MKYFTAVQCEPPESNKPATFLYEKRDLSEKPKTGRVVSPLFTSLAELYPWMANNGWHIKRNGEPWEVEHTPA